MTRRDYCTRRDLIEEEIGKRQAKWRKTDTPASPQEPSATEERPKAETAGESKAPLTRSPAKNEPPDKPSKKSTRTQT